MLFLCYHHCTRYNFNVIISYCCWLLHLEFIVLSYVNKKRKVGLFQSHNKARLGETVEMAGFSSPIEQNMRMHSAAPPALEIAEEKRSKRNPGQLDFEAAMSDFRTMFPGLDVELIESVLRANGGAVDDTIDQLLTMNVDTEAKPAANLSSSPPLLPPKPAGSLRSSTERLQVSDATPALPPREGSLKRKKQPPKVTNAAPILYNTPQTRYDTEWNGLVIPMLGKLPSNFLRIISNDSPPPRPPKSLSSKHRSHSVRNKIPTHLAEQPVSRSRATTTFQSHGANPSQTSRNRHGLRTTVGRSASERLSHNALKKQIQANTRRLQEACEASEIEGDSDRYLEDERLALIMQNEEFLRELKRNEDFMKTLEFERDMLATRLAHERKLNRQLSRLSPSSERPPPNLLAPQEISPPNTNNLTSDSTSTAAAAKTTKTSEISSPSAEHLSPSIVPVDRTDKTDVLDFRDQLKSMGTSSKKKFALIAKKFFTTSRKKRKGAGKIIRDAHGPSTLNLLDDNDDEDLIDATSGLHLEGSDHVMFEPLVGTHQLHNIVQSSFDKCP
ncbi:hypothetical protein EB796_001648 [Bugula neritina]|uniref:CUE domain-containing protein n=1 Tax=Bugula neritina TaxID=10212 RepID=A0A7J7KPD4_BUGNE|nr:hypothetical protein EB796_001648 [Bugula neritina]